MWGYGARRAALSRGVLDPLYAEAVVIAAGERKLAIVGLDLGRAPGGRALEGIRKRIREQAGIEYSFIAGSHTHHAPVLELTDEPGKGRGKFDAAIRYYRRLEDEVVAAVVEADRNLQPATLATGSARLDGFNRNRHSKLKDPPVDHDLAVMRLDSPAGKPLAVLVNFAAHPTMVEAAGLRFSADYVGAMKRTVAKELGCGVVFMQGASGDLSTDQSGRERRGHEAFGDALGREVVAVAKGLHPAEVRRPSLEVREERLAFASRVDLSQPAVAALYGAAFFPELVANYRDEHADGIRPRLTVALLNGDIALVGVSGEFFCAHAIRLRERARGVRQLFFFGYSNGYDQYFPTIEAAAQGGYGADRTVAPVEVGAGERVMDRALVLLYQMRGRL
jgi:neutral ceramidase